MMLVIAVALLPHPAAKNQDAYSGARTGANDVSTVVKSAEAAVVRIDTDTGVGTGFLVENGTTLVTNFHVVHGASEATATFHDGRQVPILGALAVMPENDLAALLLRDHTYWHASIRLAAHAPEKGERVIAFGMPEGLSFSASEGIVSAVRTGRELANSIQASTGIDVVEEIGLNPDSTWIQSSAPISPGSSGGPLVNMRGEVVGVNTMMHTEGQNLNFAISAKEVRQLCDLARSVRRHLPFPLGDN
ncbi:MAG: S1C family serine protease [Bryobacteraceae bacterium]|nr:S1C family serine protease [Bryobacteraceae bacterium]